MDTTYITPSQFNIGLLQPLRELPRKRGNSKGYTRRYLDIVCAFDIETSRLTPDITGLDRDESVMYLWQLCIYDRCIIIGRTWEEFQQVVALIDGAVSQMVNDRGPMRMVWLVHNLSYEFQFLRGHYHFEGESVYCLDARKILRADLTEHIELRCSYLHSNMTLSLYTSKMMVEHQKLSGDEFDYHEIRYPWTPLTDQQILYGIHDVLGLCEAYIKEMSIDGDNLHTVPLTSTGYVRRDIKRAMNTLSRIWLPSRLPDEYVYTLLREAFRGGDTHANRFFAGEVLEDVRSADRSSSYPGVQINHEFPTGAWNVDPFPSEQQLRKLITRYKRACVFRCQLRNVSLRNYLTGCPYIPKDKCRSLQGGVLDNGRVLSADYLEITMTDVDLQILDHQYLFQMTVTDIAYCSYSPLPDPMRDVVRKYYTLKTTLKQDPHSPDYSEETDILYMKSKNKLNSIYGCSAMDVGKQRIVYDGADYVPESTTLSERLEKSYKHAYMSYAYGVWTTAWARWELHRGIQLVENTPGAWFIYCDTDSVKYMGDVDWEKYNRPKRGESIRNNAYAKDPAGETHYMELYEADGEYSQFSTLGAKKYCYTKPGKDTIYVTIAGVTKSKGGAELDHCDDIGYGVARFAAAIEGGNEFLFREAGGTEALYNDHIDTTITIEGKSLRITSNVVIRDSTYLLHSTDEYSAMVQIEHIRKTDPDLIWANNWNT